MRVALIFAKADLRRGTRIKHFMTPPHGLQLLATLTPRGHKVTIIDEYHKLASRDLQADFVGISVWTASSTRAYMLADHYRARGIPVVLGGPHIAVCPEEAKAHGAIVIGEAESVWPQIVADAECGCLKSEYHGSILSLDATPAPDWSVVNRNHYVLEGSLATTRGCTRRCDFCTESCRPKPNFRRRSLDLVLREIDSRPAGVMAFLDNDIMADRDYGKALLEALVPRKRKWLGMTSIESANDESVLDLMAASGCRTLFVGLESINQKSLQEVHKRCNNVALYKRNIERIHQRGIMVNGAFVFGFDGDDAGVFDRTVQFGIDARLETATFTILTPYPGTKLHQRLEQEGRIFDRDWSHYDTTRVVFEPSGMSREELEHGYFEAYRKFYSWPAILHRCRQAEEGFAKRVFLNIAYKKVEPLYRFLNNPLPVGWLRKLFDWYAIPFGKSDLKSTGVEDGQIESTTWLQDKPSLPIISVENQ